MTSNHHRFLTTLTKWPVNSKKKGREYGYFLRTLLQVQRPNGNFFPGKPVDLSKQLDSLSRMGDNKYGQKYVCSFRVGASGLDRADVGGVLTDEFIEYFNKNQGILKNFFK